MEPVGVYVVSEETEFLDNRYETASWWRKVRVPAGEYPVFLKHWYGSQYLFVVDLPGVEVDQYFPSSFGGVPYTSGKRPEDNGRTATYRMDFRPYVLAGAMLEQKMSDGRNLYVMPPVRLNAEWSPAWHTFESYDGRMVTVPKMVNTLTEKEY